MTYFVTTGAHYHYVKRVEASTNGDGVLKFTLWGDETEALQQFNFAEITIFTDDAELTARLVAAVNAAAVAPAVETAAA